MVTFVGMKDDFGADLVDLVELEYDALEAYDAAIARLENEEYKENLMSFRDDHERHIKDLSDLLRKNNIDAPTQTSGAKHWMTKGKVVLGNLVGDRTILRAMRSNEIDTNTAYERICNHENMWAEARFILQEAFKDERRHKEWLNSVIETE
ncbi:MAG: ferritin-like domain-containing protein [Proteobacteria bacterium]|nr:ferritin-like domain-containing protein [Pseudomonadota bacterium]